MHQAIKKDLLDFKSFSLRPKPEKERYSLVL